MKRLFKGIFRILVIFFLLIIVLVAALIIFRNPIADYLIETAGSKVAGAKVEVDGVYLKPFKLHISWERLQFTNNQDTWENLFETGKCDFELAFRPLFASKILIEKMQLEDMRFNTDRTSDGAIEKKDITKAEPSKLMQALMANLEREKERIPVFNPDFLKTKIDVNSLLEEFNFHTPAKADSIKEIAEDRYAFWNNLIESNDYEERIKQVETNIKNINVEEMDNLIQIQQNLTLAVDSYNTTKYLYEEIKTNKGQLENDLKRLKTLYNDVPKWIKADYENAVELARLPDVSIQKIALMLFGERVTEGVMAILVQIENIRNLSDEKKAAPGKERMPHLPAFWIKEISVSAYPDEQLRLSGNIFNISSDQKKTGKPLDLKLAGKDEKIGNLSINGLFDHRSDISQDIVNIYADEIPIRDLTLANFDLLPGKLKRGTAKLFSNLNLTDELIKITVGFEAENIQFDYTSQPEMDERLVRISRSISEAIDKITFDAGITQKEKNYTFSLSSNLDKLISSQLKKVVQDEITRAKAEIEKRVYAEMDKYKDQAESYINTNNTKLQNKIDEINVRINEQKNRIEQKKKEIENRIEVEKQKLENEAGEKLGNELDDLLKQFNQ
ncbi:MAG: hypothetical protein APR54_05925 [Candidatus Cloacimonas sp. SDB]|nr:MAG: hypothetical protein APR54_05925 [Candidatus Cloacimonas sp. SDB]